MNQANEHFKTISRIAFNPSPSYISRANLVKQPIAYYACNYDVALLEACHDKLRQSHERSFLLTVSKWKIKKEYLYSSSVIALRLKMLVLIYFIIIINAA